ncbi:MAG TPA: DNA/RNA nuclease SfsA [Nitrospirota bacterium]|nr:DNA/RNA nuclease SfsA [Nitrospirota bacterium]
MKTGSFFPETVKGIYKCRPNRFIVECIVHDRTSRAYLPNPGRLWELFYPGVLLYLVKHGASYEGNTDFTVVAVERDSLPIMLHTHVNNLVARQLIEQGRIGGLENSIVIKPEVTIDNSRFDFLLNQNGKDVVVEIKSCTLVGKRIAMFPDAVTARGTKHLLELAYLAKRGIKTAVVFLVHWPNVDYFLPEHHTDLDFARTLLTVKDKVLVKAVSVEWKSSLILGRTKDLIIPWQLVGQEAHDSGSYLVVMELKRNRCLFIGKLGKVKFRKGYYVYVGSAKTALSKRIERHRRLFKKYHWHVDFLRRALDFHVALPIRASESLECELAAALEKIADWEVNKFGSSDCDCKSHLFGMLENPIQSRAFIDLLLHFRINRLEKFIP